MHKLLVLVLTAALLACAGDAAQPGPAGPAIPGPMVPTPSADRGIILFLGTSLTAGTGVSSSEAYPALIQMKLNAAQLPYRIQNAGVSRETSAGALDRLGDVLQQPMEVMVVETGVNDGARGFPVEVLAANLESVLTQVQRHDPTIRLVVVGMEAPSGRGAEYSAAFREVYAEAAARHGAALVPYLLQGVIGVDSLNLADGFHPNAAGHRVIAETVWRVLRGVLAES